MAEPVGAAPLDGLPDRRQAERLAGVDGEVGVLALEVLERVEVAGGREAGLGAGDVEARRPRCRARRPASSAISRRPGLVAHRGEQLADEDPAARRPAAIPSSKPALHRADDLVEGQAPGEVLLGGVAHLGVDDAVRGQVLGALAGDPGQRVGVCMTATVWSKVSR